MDIKTIPIKGNDKISEVNVYSDDEAFKIFQEEEGRAYRIVNGETPEKGIEFIHNIVMFDFEGDKKCILSLKEDSYAVDSIFVKYEDDDNYYAFNRYDYIDTYLARRIRDSWYDSMENDPDALASVKLIHSKKDEKLKLCDSVFCQKELDKHNLIQEYPVSDNHPLVKYVNEICKQNDLKFQEKVFYAYLACDREEYLESFFNNYFDNGHYKEVEQILNKNYFSKDVEKIIDQTIDERGGKIRMYRDDCYVYKHTNLQGKLQVVDHYEKMEKIELDGKFVNMTANSLFNKFRNLMSEFSRKDIPNQRIVKGVNPEKPELWYFNIRAFALPEDEWDWAVTKEFKISWEGKEKTLKPGDRIHISERDDEWFIKEIEECYYNREKLKQGKLVWDPQGYNLFPVWSMEFHDRNERKYREIIKNSLLKETAKVITGELFLNKEEMKSELECQLNKTLRFGRNPFFEDVFNSLIQNSVNTWWDEGYRDELLEAAKHRLEKDAVFSEYFEKYLTQVNIESAAIHANEFEKICDELKEKFYIDRLKDEFKDIVPETKDIEIYIENEKLIDTEYDFNKVVDTYIKETKNYQAAEMVSVWDKEMIKDYSDFLINKIENNDRNADKYYDKMLEIEKKHDLPIEFKKELEKVKDVYEDKTGDKEQERDTWHR